MMYYLKQIKGIRDILPILMVVLTKHDRERIDPKWSKNNWTHNVFRAYEILFWRKKGIRPEAACSIADGVQIVQFFTKEAAIAHTEKFIRLKLSSLSFPKLRFDFFKDLSLAFQIITPQMAMANGMRMPKSGPFLFAIALGASLGSASVGSTTVVSIGSLAISGSNLATVAWGESETPSTVTVVITWDDGSGGSSQTFTQIGGYKIIDTNANIQRISFWGLLAPNTSNSRILATFSGSTSIQTGATYYSGVKQSAAFTTGSSGNTNGVTTIAQADTSDADGSWHVGTIGDNNNTLSVGANTTARATLFSIGTMICDSNATVANTVSHTFNWNQSVSGAREAWITTMMRPAVAAGPTNMKTYDTNAIANIKTMNTNPIANIKSFDTNT